MRMCITLDKGNNENGYKAFLLLAFTQSSISFYSIIGIKGNGTIRKQMHIRFKLNSDIMQFSIYFVLSDKKLCMSELYQFSDTSL
jgi:hypothetical protein